MQARVGRSHPENVGSGIAKRIPRGVVAVRKGNFSTWLHPGALRTSPVPGGVPEYQLDHYPWPGAVPHLSHHFFFRDFVTGPLRLACPVRRFGRPSDRSGDLPDQITSETAACGMALPLMVDCDSAL